MSLTHDCYIIRHLSLNLKHSLARAQAAPPPRHATRGAIVTDSEILTASWPVS
jgi:hypothetical protein